MPAMRDRTLIDHGLQNGGFFTFFVYINCRKYYNRGFDGKFTCKLLYCESIKKSKKLMLSYSNHCKLCKLAHKCKQSAILEPTVCWAWLRNALQLVLDWPCFTGVLDWIFVGSRWSRRHKKSICWLVKSPTMVVVLLTMKLNRQILCLSLIQRVDHLCWWLYQSMSWSVGDLADQRDIHQAPNDGYSIIVLVLTGFRFIFLTEVLGL